MDDPAARAQAPAVEVPPPEFGRVVAGEHDEGAGYHVRRSRGTQDWLLLHTVAGAGLLRPSAGPPLRLGPGAAALIAPGTVHDYGTDPAGGRWRLLYAHVHPPASWTALLDWPEAAPGTGLITLGAEVEARVLPSLRSAARATRLEVGRPELFALNGLEAALLWYDTQNPRRHRIDERLLRVLEHIDAHLAEDLSLRRLAEVAHLSPSRFSHLFSAQVGSAPAAYVEAQRLELAAHLLELTPDPVARIARRVGYADPLYFSRRFRARHGVSPREHQSRRRA
ncbi:AraC family transcriptional regulator [Brachybacterium sp. SGAir0954]|uniref:helix-turn-helix domain-containing protein n=1 Tax=Brachybacterium sp. SGAir0954 TaxID=2571029 RepID=UPI0010CD411E|nr:helix-turn-helix domain-containing protein [Brachybacterium sp. SGAir0954]QCR52888.1 AraC family transcriptional regulator [Brachybacterium sp. SGAir0954]